MNTTEILDLKTQEKINNAVKIAMNDIQSNKKDVDKSFMNKMPEILKEFLKILSSSLLAFFLFAKLFNFISGSNEVYFLAFIGWANSFYVTKMKLLLNKDPKYKIPSCKCGQGKYTNMEHVLKHPTSSLLFGVPNSIFGLIFYSTLLYLKYILKDDFCVILASTSCLGSVYLAYILIFEIKYLCNVCCSIYSINILILIKLLNLFPSDASR
jgi:uncharacterized membrane protein